MFFFNSLIRNLFASMPLAIILLFIYVVSIGSATFVENIYGTVVANDVIYHSCWFYALNIWVLLNILGSMFISIKHSGFKIPFQILHIAFVITIIGAGITRYYGFEGVIQLKNGDTGSFITSSDKFLNVFVSNELADNEGEESINPLESYKNGFDISLSPYTRSSFETKIQVFNKELDIKSFRILNLSTLNLDVLSDDKIAMAEKKKENLYLASFRVSYDGEVINFDIPNNSNRVIHRFKNRYIIISWGSKQVKLPFEIKLNKFEVINYPGTQMASSYASFVEILDEELKEPFEYKIYLNHVLDYKGYRFFQSSYTNEITEVNGKMKINYTGTVLSVNKDPGKIPTYIGYTLMIIGSILLLIYPGTRFHKLSKFLKNQKIISIAIFIFSLNYPIYAQDFNLNNLQNRWTKLNSIMNDTSDENILQRFNNVKKIPKDLIDSFKKLQIQNSQGRIELMDTFSSGLIRKITNSDSFNGLDNNEFLIYLLSAPQDMRKIRMIYVKNPEIRRLLGVKKDKYVSFNDVFDIQKIENVNNIDELLSNAYKIYDFVESANKKRDAEKSEFDKEILKLNEKINYVFPNAIFYYLKIFPLAINFKPHNIENIKNENSEKKNTKEVETQIEMHGVENKSILKNIDFDPHAWIAPTDDIFDNKIIGNENIIIMGALRSLLVNEFLMGIVFNNYSGIKYVLDSIHKFQLDSHNAQLLTSNLVNAEILLNKTNVFPISQYIYLLFGIILFIFAIISILRNKSISKNTNRIFFLILLGVFTFHTLGLLFRWYIGGHAPWSNSYESMLYISWATALSGIIILRKSILTLCGASFLAGMVLTVAHWGFMDPQIGNLVPVLNSYWLNIHVSIIVASYGFLGLCFMLGIINLILFLLNSKKRPQIESSILSLTAINEMSMLIGVLMLTVGTFLGGIWANESWGRYWSWDSKETWSLVSIGVYAIILHIRFLQLKNLPYVFNSLSVFGFYSILMTYFGVNYYLSGLHSYASGTPLEIDYKLNLFFATTISLVFLSFFKRKLLKKFM